VKRLAVAFLLAAALAALPAEAAVGREAVAAVEKNIDGAVRTLDVNDPYDLLGFTRGIYLPGYGIVFTAEVNLVQTMITPFHPEPTGAQRTRLRQKKILRLQFVREMMRQVLVAAAATLDGVPPNEQVVVGVTLFYRAFEEREGLPGQIILQAPRQALLDFKANRISRSQLDAVTTVQEL